ncbi:hypothetical protein QTO34_006275 [Cnephaeus nilssonii]|uniref:Uncharacterized protein n=1 Tax=Cnephaeus nilssonii TaxID=3371016 RepID=A0AA40LHK3_CNENI|nr:hypothetical protein QTO34_006275 [Eptesicus nilssonii]
MVALFPPGPGGRPLPPGPALSGPGPAEPRRLEAGEGLGCSHGNCEELRVGRSCIFEMKFFVLRSCLALTLLLALALLASAASAGATTLTHCQHLVQAPISRCKWRLLAPVPLTASPPPSAPEWQSGQQPCPHLLTVPAPLTPAAGAAPNCSSRPVGVNGAVTISAWEQWQQERGCRQTGLGATAGGASSFTVSVILLKKPLQRKQSAPSHPVCGLPVPLSRQKRPGLETRERINEDEMETQKKLKDVGLEEARLVQGLEKVENQDRAAMTLEAAQDKQYPGDYSKLHDELKNLENLAVVHPDSASLAGENHWSEISEQLIPFGNYSYLKPLTEDSIELSLFCTRGSRKKLRKDPCEKCLIEDLGASGEFCSIRTHLNMEALDKGTQDHAYKF